MRTLYIHDGVAYINKDLAILNGADKLSMYELQLNESDGFEMEILSPSEMVIIDDYGDDKTIELNGSLEYLDSAHTLKGISKESRERISEFCTDYAVDYLFNS